MSDLATSVAAVLIAQGCNLGFVPVMKPGHQALTRDRLSHVEQNYLRAETLAAANARLIHAQAGIGLAQLWGGGLVASVDGLRFVVPVRTLDAGPNPHYFGTVAGRDLAQCHQRPGLRDRRRGGHRHDAGLPARLGCVTGSRRRPDAGDQSRHRLARKLFHGQRGELRQRYREGQEDQLGALGLVLNAVVLWNTRYIDAAITELDHHGAAVEPADATRLSPLIDTHLNVHGRYAFPPLQSEATLRPLRDPAAVGL